MELGGARLVETEEQRGSVGFYRPEEETGEVATRRGWSEGTGEVGSDRRQRFPGRRAREAGGVSLARGEDDASGADTWRLH